MVSEKLKKLWDIEKEKYYSKMYLGGINTEEK